MLRSERRRWVLVVGVCAVGTTLAAVEGCSSSRIETCGVLPDITGCPVGRGGTCEDPSCSSLYDCVQGSWVLAEACEPTHGAGGAGGSGSASTGGEGGVMCNGVTIDRTGEAVGCSPPLQEPDCPAGAAELCRPCSTVCVDFFLCTEDGWEAVAFCDGEGNVIVQP